MKNNDKFDVMLDINAPDFAERLKEAIGLKDGEALEIIMPQFDRADGLQVPIPIMDFTLLPSLSEETLEQIGCQQWDKPDAEGNVLWLFPAEWYNYIPDGLDIVTISNRRDKFHAGKTNNDRRFGALSFGFLRQSPQPSTS